MPGGVGEQAPAAGEARRKTRLEQCGTGVSGSISACKFRWLAIAVSVVVLTGCAAQIRTVPPDWENPSHRLVGEELLPLLQAAGRDPDTCEVLFFETEHLNAASLGKCTFGFTTGLADTQASSPILETGNRRVVCSQDCRGFCGAAFAHACLAHGTKPECSYSGLRAGVGPRPTGQGEGDGVIVQ